MTRPANPSDIQLFDYFLPSLAAGTWYLSAEQTVLDKDTAVNTDTLITAQQAIVVAPQFAISKDEVLAVYPPNTSTGQYADELPHVVLTEPMLPWERALSAAERTVPWLALLVLSPDEIVGGAGTATGAVSTTVGQFLDTTDASVLKPQVAAQAGVHDSDPMTMITLSTSTFAAVAPWLDELPYLAHCRTVDTSKQAVLSESGTYSVVVANRFPAAPATAGGEAVPSRLHLVSVEGLEKYLTDSADFGNAQTVALASLASWSCATVADPGENFRGAMADVVANGQGETARLRLPPDGVDATTESGAEASQRLTDGFVPLPWTTRSGESTMAWYRGPLTPFPMARKSGNGRFNSPDAALIYHAAFGVFDTSLAAAFEIGRGAALADAAFSQRLTQLRKAGHRFVDALYQRLVSDAFAPADISALSGQTVQAQLRALLAGDLSRRPGPGASGTPSTASVLRSDATPQAALAALMSEPEVQAGMADAVDEQLTPIAQWLANVVLLRGLPFIALIPTSNLLPAESIRMFHLDANWIAACLDGALSIGTECSRDVFFDQIFGDTLRLAAYDAVQTLRDSIPGIGSPRPADGGLATISGILLRSRVVTGWPHLEVLATDSDRQALITQRMDHLADDVVLCLFSGVPSTVTIAEPSQGFRFGVDDDGRTSLRALAPFGSTTVGDTFAGDPTVVVRDPRGVSAACMRAADSRVLRLAPTDSDGLVGALAHALATTTGTTYDLGPSDLAMQMIAPPEAVVFTVGGAS